MQGALYSGMSGHALPMTIAAGGDSGHDGLIDAGRGCGCRQVSKEAVSVLYLALRGGTGVPWAFSEGWLAVVALTPQRRKPSTPTT